MQVFVFLFTLLFYELQYPSVVLLVLGLSESIEFKRKCSLLFGLLNDKVKIIEFDLFLFPGVQNGFLDINFAFFFESLVLGFPLFN